MPRKAKEAEKRRRLKMMAERKGGKLRIFHEEFHQITATNCRFIILFTLSGIRISLPFFSSFFSLLWAFLHT